MTNSNLTILEKNTLMGLEHEDTQRLYLRGSQKDERKAFKMACEYQDKIRPFLYVIVSLGSEQHRDNSHAIKSPEAIAEDVIEYIGERHYRSYFPNQ